MWEKYSLSSFLNQIRGDSCLGRILERINSRLYKSIYKPIHPSLGRVFDA